MRIATQEVFGTIFKHLRRRPWKVAHEKTVSYPFGEEPVEWKMGVVPHQNNIHHISYEEGTWPLRESIRANEKYSVYEGKPGSVIKLARETRISERAIVLQSLLEAFEIPHLKLKTDEVSLQQARNGIMIQEEIPAGSRSLDEIAKWGYNKRWSVAKDVILGQKRLSREALEELEEFKKKLAQINDNPTLVREAEDRGYAVTDRSSDGDKIIIDFKDGGIFGKNIYYHPERGWFLVDW